MSSDPGDSRGAGWVLFASMVMVVVGGWNIFEGLFALIDDEKMLALGSGHFLILDTTAWGWMQLLLGVLVLVTGLGLLGGSGLAQGVAVFLVAINAISQVFTIPVFPFWAISMLVLDVFVIWALCVYRPAKFA